MCSIRSSLGLPLLLLTACGAGAQNAPLTSTLEPPEPTGPPWESWQPEEKSDELTTGMEGMEAFDHRIVEDLAFMESSWHVVFALLDTMRVLPGQTPATKRTTDTVMLAFDVVAKGQIQMDVTYLWAPVTEGMLWRWRIPLDRGAPGQEAQLAIRFLRPLTAATDGFESVVFEASADTTETPKWRATITADAVRFEAQGQESRSQGDQGLMMGVLKAALWEKSAGAAYLEPAWRFRTLEFSALPWPVAGLKVLRERPLENVGLQSAFPPSLDDIEGFDMTP